jgi:hypothetical protein
MTGPVEPEDPSARAWLACALLVASAVVLVVGLLALGADAKGSLALVVGPAVALAAAGAALAR